MLSELAKIFKYCSVVFFSSHDAQGLLFPNVERVCSTVLGKEVCVI